MKIIEKKSENFCFRLNLLNCLGTRDVEADAVKFLWKQKNLKKEAGSGSKNILLLPHPCLVPNKFVIVSC